MLHFLITLLLNASLTVLCKHEASATLLDGARYFLEGGQTTDFGGSCLRYQAYIICLLLNMF